MKNLLIVAVLAFTTTGCAVTAENESGFNTKVKDVHYNSISAKYYETATFATTYAIDGNTFINYKANNSGSVTIAIDNPEEVKIMLNKFLKWENLATTSGDVFTKVLGKVTTNLINSTMYNKYKFHSGNENSHYLIIERCSVFDQCLTENRYTFTLDVSNVKIMLSEIEELEANGIRSLPTNKYN